MRTSLITSLKGNLTFKAARGFVSTEFNWTKPASWPELRHITPKGSLGFLLSDKYPAFAFSAEAEGGYKVLLNGGDFGVYASGGQCALNIADLPSSAATLVSCPEALSVYVFTVSPVKENAEIKNFKCTRSNSSGTQEQGLLWLHSAVSGLMDRISVSDDNDSKKVRNRIIEAVTCSQEEIKVKDVYGAFNECSALKYCAPLNYMENASKNYCTFRNCSNLKRLIFRNFKPLDMINMFANMSSLETAEFKNADFSALTSAIGAFINAESLQMSRWDLSGAVQLKKVECRGTRQKPIPGFKGLKVSSSAPFNESAPQIDVSYTGMDKNAVLELFDSLPQVQSGQKINITGTPACETLSEEDLQTAVNKGWEVLQ